MLKKISSLGTSLNKTEQQRIEGGIRNTMGWDCGPPHCPGVCTTGPSGNPYCLPY